MGILPVYSDVWLFVTFHAGAAPLVVLGWGLWLFVVLFAVLLTREAVRSWKRLGRKFLSTGSGVAVVVTAAVGFLWGWLVAGVLLLGH